MALNAQPIPLNFPLQGVVENVAYAGPAAPSAVKPGHILNMRPYDALERRRRGGQRTGTEKFIDTELAGGTTVQLIDTLVEAVEIIENAAIGSKQADPATTGDNQEYITWTPDGAYVAFWDSSNTTSGVTLYPVTVSGGLGTLISFPSLGDVMGGDFDPNGGYIATVADAAFSNSTLNILAFSGGTVTSSPVDTDTLSYDTRVLCQFHPDGEYLLVYSRLGNPSSQLTIYPWDAGTETLGTPIALPGSLPSSCGQAAWSPDGDYLLMVGASPHVMAWPFNPTTGTFGARTSAGGATSDVYDDCAWAPDGSYVVVANRTAAELYAFSSGVFSGKTTITGANVARSVTVDPTSTYTIVGFTSGNGMAAFETSAAGVSATLNTNTDPAGAAFVRFNPTSNQQFAIANSTAGTVSATYTFTPKTVNADARSQTVLAVVGGDVFRSTTDFASFSLATNGNDALNAVTPVRGDTAFQNYFFVDGVYANYQYMPLGNSTMTDWAGDLTAGALPQGTTDTTLGCSIIAVYRGRVVLSGLKEEPQNWFMSAAGDPFDFDYSPATTSATQAVAGNNSDAGELGDIITALAPYQDDVLIMGGANSVWVMRGDPAAGGRIDNLTRGIGITGPEAWTFDTRGFFYFMGINGLYRMSPGGGGLELVSKGKLDDTFSDINFKTSRAILVYDQQWQGVHIFISGFEQPASAATHYWYDERTDSFWPDKYPNDHGPTAVGPLLAGSPEDNTILLGGYDGYIRNFKDGAMNDDGEAIDSFFRVPIIHPALTMGQVQLTDMQINLDAGGGASTALDIYQGNTPEEVADETTAGYTATLNAGRNLPHRKRLRGNALQMRLRNNAAGETWAYEAGNALIAGVGRVRASL